MKYAILFFLAIITTISLSGQREMIITEMSNDGDAVIQIESADPSASDYTQMILGFNSSNAAWIRTVTDHPLSFYTNNNRRMTLTKNGFLGIGTSTPESKLFVNNGRIGMETIGGSLLTGGSLYLTESTGLDLFTGNDKKAELNYLKISSFTSTLSLRNLDGGDIVFTSGTTDRLELISNGDVRVNDLAGSGTRNVVVTADGRLDTEPIVPAATTGLIAISPTDFHNTESFAINPDLISGGITGASQAFYPIDLPDGAVLTKMNIFYSDANGLESFDVGVRLWRSSHNSGSALSHTILDVFESSGSPSNNVFQDVILEVKTLNWTIGDPAAEKSTVVINCDIQTGISAITIEYTL